MTGAASGIGEAIAKAFIEAGALLCDLSCENAALPFRGPRSPLATYFNNVVRCRKRCLS